MIRKYSLIAAILMAMVSGVATAQIGGEIPQLAAEMERASHRFHERIDRFNRYSHLGKTVEELEVAAANFKVAVLDREAIYPKASVCRLWRGVQGGMSHVRKDFYDAHRVHHEPQLRRDYIEIFSAYENLYIEMLGQCVDVPEDEHDESDDRRGGRGGHGRRGDDHDHN